MFPMALSKKTLKKPGLAACIHQVIKITTRGGQYRGTFVPLSVPSLLFKNCTFFGTADTFFALLSSIFGTICGMEF